MDGADPVTSRRLGGVLTCAVLMIAVTGCGDDTDPGPKPTGSAHSTGAPSDTGDPTDTASSSPSSTVRPADGEEIRTDTFTVTVPQRFTEVDRTYDISIPANDFGTGESIYVGNLRDMLEQTLPELEAASTQESGWRGTPRSLPPVTLAGMEWYHLSGRDITTDHADEFGTWHEGTVVTLRFNLDGPAATRQATIDSTLATFAWL